MRHEGAGRARQPARPLVPVVLAGGSGSRLWPVSRGSRPKPYHAFGGDRPLLDLALERAAWATDCAPIVVANEAHRFLAAERCRVAGADGAVIGLEPDGRGTAAAVAFGAHLARRAHTNPLVLVLAADHRVGGARRFAGDVGTAAALAASKRRALVVFGAVPTRAESGYGYIETAGRRSGVERVRAFVEKPEALDAEAFVASGRHLWNCGMFVFDAGGCLRTLASLCPELAVTVGDAVAQGTADGCFFRPGNAYGRALCGSFDELVMERTDRALVLRAAFDWADVGSWHAVRENGPRDAHGNRLVGDVAAVDVAGSLVYAEARLVAAIGLRNVAVVETEDAVLVANRERLDGLGALVAELAADGRAEVIAHGEVLRPWGHFECVDEGPGHRVKRLVVAPGERISLQRHARRSEHWVVVRGVAEVTRDTETFPLRESESVFIPAGTAHRLRNPGREPLEIVEVQVGEDLSEDDIVRLEDDYGRGAPGEAGR